MHPCVSQYACVCVCVCAGRPERHCEAATTAPPSPPTCHNKEQLNTAALPAEEPTASHTSTNRQICLKPKGRSNKSQPTESSPLRSPSADSNQKVTGWLHPITHYHSSGRITITCAVLHVKPNPGRDVLHMVSAHQLYGHGTFNRDHTRPPLCSSQDLYVLFSESTRDSHFKKGSYLS